MSTSSQQELAESPSMAYASLKLAEKVLEASEMRFHEAEHYQYEAENRRCEADRRRETVASHQVLPTSCLHLMEECQEQEEERQAEGERVLARMEDGQLISIRSVTNVFARAMEILRCHTELQLVESEGIQALWRAVEVFEDAAIAASLATDQFQRTFTALQDADDALNCSAIAIELAKRTVGTIESVVQKTNKECPICYSAIRGEPVWCRAECGQNFCKSCLDAWAKSQSPIYVRCPFCRSHWCGE